MNMDCNNVSEEYSDWFENDGSNNSGGSVWNPEGDQSWREYRWYEPLGHYDQWFPWSPCSPCSP